MKRVASVTAAAALTVLSGVASTFAFALTPLGGWVREHVIGDEYAYCSAQWLELAQLPLPPLALIVSGGALYRSVRLRISPGWYLTCALLLLVAWWSIGAIGDCALANDE